MRNPCLITLWITASLALAVILAFWLMDYYCAPVYTPAVIAPQTEPPSIADVEIKEQYDSMEYSKNKVGWLQVPGAELDEPVMQADDNAYYLTHDAQDNPDPYGACFALNTCNVHSLAELSRVTVLFGHSAGHTDKTGFSRLQRLKDPAIAAEHRYIYLQLTDGRLTLWEIFAAGDYPVSYDYLIAEPDDDYFLWQLDEMKSRSFSTYEGVLVTERDHILILSTCNGDPNTRFLVCAVLIEA